MFSKKTILAWLLGGILLPTIAFSMRCSQNLVYVGDSQFQVEQKCGEPLSKTILNNSYPYYQNQNPNYQPTPVTEVWNYQSSPSDFLYQVYFMDGVVTSITANRNP